MFAGTTNALGRSKPKPNCILSLILHLYLIRVWFHNWSDFIPWNHLLRLRLNLNKLCFHRIFFIPSSIVGSAISMSEKVQVICHVNFAFTFFLYQRYLCLHPIMSFFNWWICLLPAFCSYSSFSLLGSHFCLGNPPKLLKFF